MLCLYLFKGDYFYKYYGFGSSCFMSGELVKLVSRQIMAPSSYCLREPAHQYFCLFSWACPDTVLYGVTSTLQNQRGLCDRRRTGHEMLETRASQQAALLLTGR